jgi:hypothetical protein
VFTFPDNVVKPEYSTAIVAEVFFHDFENFLDCLAKNPENMTLKMGEAAEHCYTEWFNHNAKIINDTEGGYLKGVYGKLDIICIRIAIVIRGMNLFFNSESSDEVTAEEMAAAINITEYFRATALKVYHRIFNDKKLPEVTKAQVARFLVQEMSIPKATVSRLLKTSRTQVDRVNS